MSRKTPIAATAKSISEWVGFVHMGEYRAVAVRPAHGDIDMKAAAFQVVLNVCGNGCVVLDDEHFRE